MKTISDYTIFCTEAQTKKALELGAPIENYNYTFGNKETCTYLGKDYTKLPALDWFAQQPTAEQMCGWLEGQGAIKVIAINNSKNLDWSFHITTKDNEVFASIGYKSRKEATHAAIDEALEYLENNRK